MSQCANVDVIIICVPTPLGKHQEPDLSFVTGTMDALAPFLREGQLISLESTTYPGTTEEEIVPRVQEQGLRVGKISSSFIRPSGKTSVISLSKLKRYPRLWEGTAKRV